MVVQVPGGGSAPPCDPVEWYTTRRPTSSSLAPGPPSSSSDRPLPDAVSHPYSAEPSAPRAWNPQVVHGTEPEAEPESVHLVAGSAPNRAPRCRSRSGPAGPPAVDPRSMNSPDRFFGARARVAGLIVRSPEISSGGTAHMSAAVDRMPSAPAEAHPRARRDRPPVPPCRRGRERGSHGPLLSPCSNDTIGDGRSCFSVISSMSDSQ